MNNLRESRLYIDFFRKNLLIILIPALFGIGSALYAYNQAEEVKVIEQVFEFEYDRQLANFVEKQSDEAVALLRSKQQMQGLGIKEKLIVFKPGPFLVKIQAKGINKQQIAADLEKANSYMINTYPVSNFGEPVLYSEKPQLWRFLMLGFLAGLGVGVISSLTVSYFRYY